MEPVKCKRPRSCLSDYSMCILCQEDRSTSLCRVTEPTFEKLKIATVARQDEPALRLETDLNRDSFIAENTPVWHPECRNVYILKKKL
jgi:hypothetical protein